MNGKYFYFLCIGIWIFYIDDDESVKIFCRKKVFFKNKGDIYIYINSKKNDVSLCVFIFFLMGVSGDIAR